jgi:integrase/recombinase XerD
MQTATSTAVAVRDPLFSPKEEHALVGFLAGDSGPTREAYALDLGQFVGWCAAHGVRLFGARRADIEAFGHHSRHRVGRGRPSRDGCARSRVSTGTPKKND